MDLLSVADTVLDWVSSKFGPEGLTAFLLGCVFMYLIQSVKQKMMIILLLVVIVFIASFMMQGQEVSPDTAVDLAKNISQSANLSGW
jgi:hypothetical protein